MSNFLDIDHLKRRRTKIVSTLGPKSNNPKTIEALIEAGVQIFRLNMSHGTHDDHRQAYRAIREISEKLGLPISILGDLCGPKIRTGTFENNGIHLITGEQVVVTTREVEGKPGLIPSQYKALASDVKLNDRILLADGLMELRVDSIEQEDIQCTIVHGGFLGNRKGINLPGVEVSAPALTDKDRVDAKFALELGVDYLALSFVRSQTDILQLREIVDKIKPFTGIIAKIEKPEALDCINAIIEASDGIMVARGDLGVELPAERIPLIQDKLVDRARTHNKPVIVATQMLESMMSAPKPTRAEVADISHAVSSGVDAVMLSGETAMGDHPIEAVRVMNRIARETEGYQWRNSAFRSIIEDDKNEGRYVSVRDAVANAAASLSRELRVRALVLPSMTGTTTRVVSASRPAAPMLALSESIEACRRMNLYWGVIPILIVKDGVTDHKTRAIQKAKELGLVEKGHYILLIKSFNPDPELETPTITVLAI